MAPTTCFVFDSASTWRRVDSTATVVRSATEPVLASPRLLPCSDAHALKTGRRLPGAQFHGN